MEQTRRPLAVDEVTFAGPLEPGQVLVRIHYSGICGKQIEEYLGSAGPDRFLPHLLGHEGSGQVVDVGPGVRQVKPGDDVVLHWLKGGGIDAAAPWYTRRGERVNAGWITTFNEYGVISENRLTAIPPGCNLAAAALLGCAATTGLGVVLYEANVRPGQSVAVFGCGGVGLSAVQGAALLSAWPIVAVDVNGESLELAQRLGATHMVRGDLADAAAAVREATGGAGAEVVIVATAAPAALEQAVAAGSTPGAVYVAAVPPAGAKVSLEALGLHRRRMITGSNGGGTLPDRDIPRFLTLYERGKIKLDELITNTIPLEQINQGVAQVLSGRAGRCLVRMTDGA